MKMIKKPLMFAVIIVMFAALSAFASCFGDGSSTSTAEKELSIKLDEEFVDGTEIPYAKEISFPSAVVVDENGDVVSYEIVYRIIDADGNITESSYPDFELSPATYTIEYYYSDKLKLSFGFSVIDSDKPTITFSNVPKDLFIGETEYANLPTVKIEDASEVEAPVKKLTFKKIGETTATEVAYNKMTDSFEVGEYAGTFTYTVSVADIWGNKNTAEITWEVKDYNWAAPELENGYAADFSDKGYLNYVRSGNMSPYWNIDGNYTDEWLEVFNGASGVLKLEIGFTPENYNVMSVKLPKALRKSDLEGKYLAVRAYVSGSDLDNFFGFGGLWYMDGQDSAASIRQTGLKKDQWAVYYISYEDLVRAKCYSDENNPESDIAELQFCFKRTDALMTTMTLYVDRITIAEKLASTELSVSESDKVVWEAVENAVGYIVTEGAEVTETTATEYAFKGTKGVVSVVVKGDDLKYLNSESVTVAYGITPKDGEYASFDDELYSYLVSDKVNVGSETAGYAPTSVENAYNDGVFNTTFAQGSWGIVSSLAVKFPSAVDVSNVKYLVIKMSVYVETELSRFAVYDLDYTKLLSELKPESGLNAYIIDISDKNLTTLSGIEFILQSKEGNVGNVNVTLEYIAGANELGTPNVTNDKQNRKITWEKVENATGYVVKVSDNEEVTLGADVTEYSYPATGYGTVTVYAKGDGKNYFDGAKAEIRYDSREILDSVGGFTVEGKIVRWTANEKASGYKVRVNGEEKTVDKAEYEITERGFITIEVKATGDGVSTADGEYVLACSGDYFLEERYLSDFTEGYEKLVDNNVNAMLTNDYLVEDYSAAYVADGDYTEITLGSLKYSAYGAIRIQFPNKKATSGKYVVRYKVVGLTGGALSVSKFRIIECDGGWVLENGETAFNGEWTSAEVTLDEGAASGLVFVFDGASANGLKLCLDYILKTEKLGTPEITSVDNATKTVSWNVVANATGYEIVKDGKVWKTVTETSASCEGIGTFEILGVRAVGGAGYETSDVTTVDVTLNGDEWVEIAGTLTIINLSYSENGLIQLEFDKTGLTADSAIDYSGLIIEANGGKIAATDFAYGNEVKFNVYANYPLTAENGASTVVFKAGSVLVQSGKLYKIANDFTVAYNSQKSDSPWVVVSDSAFEWSSTWSNIVQFKFDRLFTAGNINPEGLIVYGNGVKLSGVTALANTDELHHIQFITDAFPTSGTNGYSVPTVVIKAGSVIMQNDSKVAARIAKDITLVYTDKWAMGELLAVRVSWDGKDQTPPLIQIQFANLFANYAIDLSEAEILFNGTKATDITAVANPDDLHHVQFKSDSFPANVGDTIVIKKGSIIKQDKIEFVVTEDIVLEKGESIWQLK